jgi:SLOG cluster3 family
VRPRACILLSASVPRKDSEYVLDAEERMCLDEAVMQLARAAFSNGVRLVFGGHPAISPLVATIAGEYGPAEITAHPEDPLGDALAGIYQSRVFAGLLPDETLLLFRMGFARIRWTEGAPGEKFDPKLKIEASKQVPNSLTIMRQTMVAEPEPDALVVAGGMDGIHEEIQLFRDRDPNAPIYILGKTGGAAARHKEFGFIDQQMYDQLRDKPVAGLSNEIRPAVLYPIVMQTIVSEVLRGC